MVDYLEIYSIIVLSIYSWKGVFFMSSEVVIVLDFGYSLDDNNLSTVDEIALATLQYAKSRDYNCVILAQSKTYEQIGGLSGWKLDQLYELPVGQSTSFGTGGGSTWQVLNAAKDFMNQHDLGTDAVLFTHELHFDRAQKQAAKIGIRVQKPEHALLPILCHSTAAQWWCRNRLFWRLREMFGCILLKQKGQL